MKTTALLIDIGNTSATMGIAEGMRIIRRDSLLGKNASPANVRKAVARLTGSLGVGGAVVSSVAPSKNAIWLSAIKELTGIKPMLVTFRSRLGITVDYPRPESIGADRLVDAAAAYWLYGAPAIIADFGTALTFDVVNAKGAYCGGIIAPGLPLMMDYLHDRTELLPRTGIKSCVKAYGRSTVEAMRVGACIGYAGMIDKITGHMLKGISGKVRLIATGGYANIALKHSRFKYQINPNLTLTGLARIFALNSETTTNRGKT